MLSLKGFHIFFVVASIILCMMVAAWGVQRFVIDGSPAGGVMAVLFAVSGIALALYGVRYFGKLRRLD